MIDVRIISDFAADGIAVWIAHRGTETRMILRAGEDSYTRWELVDPLVSGIRPSLTLSDDVARTLLDALLRHYEGASDMRTVRSDLLHERSRVDNLIGFIQRILIQAQQT